MVILEHKSIICAGYSAVMHIHCAAEEVTVRVQYYIIIHLIFLDFNLKYKNICHALVSQKLENSQTDHSFFLFDPIHTGVVYNKRKLGKTQRNSRKIEIIIPSVPLGLSRGRVSLYLN